MIKDILVFSLSSNVALTKSVCALLGIEASKSEVHHFADGECLATSLADVRGKKVYIIQSTCKPVNDRIMETLIFIDGVKRANCREVTVIMPYYGYARQDRIAHINEPISAKLVADLFTNAGVKRVLTVELHTPQNKFKVSLVFLLIIFHLLIYLLNTSITNMILQILR